MPWGGALHVFCSCEQPGLWGSSQYNLRLLTHAGPVALPRDAQGCCDHSEERGHKPKLPLYLEKLT